MVPAIDKLQASGLKLLDLEELFDNSDPVTAIKFRYAPLTSVNIERFFSKFKSLHLQSPEIDWGKPRALSSDHVYQGWWWWFSGRVVEILSWIYPPRFWKSDNIATLFPRLNFRLNLPSFWTKVPISDYVIHQPLFNSNIKYEILVDEKSDAGAMNTSFCFIFLLSFFSLLLSCHNSSLLLSISQLILR